MRDSFGWYRALDTTTAQNENRGAEKLSQPVLAIDGSESLGTGPAETMKLAADNVQTLIIRGAGHWAMEQAPEQIPAARTGFGSVSAGRLSPPIRTSSRLIPAGAVTERLSIRWDEDFLKRGASGLFAIKRAEVIVAVGPCAAPSMAEASTVTSLTRLFSQTESSRCACDPDRCCLDTSADNSCRAFLGDPAASPGIPRFVKTAASWRRYDHGAG